MLRFLSDDLEISLELLGLVCFSSPVPCIFSCQVTWFEGCFAQGEVWNPETESKCQVLKLGHYFLILAELPEHANYKLHTEIN